MKYEAIYSLKSLGLFSTFVEAFKAIYVETKKSPSIDWQILETTVWIINKKGSNSPIFFYDARDIMCEMGYLVDGKWVKE